MLNIQGDVIALLDEHGNIVVEYTYDAWGAPLSTTGSLAATLGAANPFRYRSYYWDSETGLYYLQSRYYNPEWGRFINADDPMALFYSGDELLGTNLFAYCNNNPANYLDNTGCFPISIRNKGFNTKAVKITINPGSVAGTYFALQAFKMVISGIIAGVTGIGTPVTIVMELGAAISGFVSYLYDKYGSKYNVWVEYQFSYDYTIKKFWFTSFRIYNIKRIGWGIFEK